MNRIQLCVLGRSGGLAVLAVGCGGRAVLSAGGIGGSAETASARIVTVAFGGGGFGGGAETSTAIATAGSDGGATDRSPLDRGIPPDPNSPCGIDGCGVTSRGLGVATGEYHTCAIAPAGAVKCWGANFLGQLGKPPSAYSSVPIDVVGLPSGIVAISGGWGFTCALTDAGAVTCWGSNSNGQLGNNSTTDSPTPVNVAGLSSGVIAISVGNYHACALTNTGGVKCWGVDYANLNGLQGSPSTSESAVPLDVMGLSSGVTAISCGGDHTCVLKEGGGVKCWGFNANGQLGNGFTMDSPVPVDVVGLSSGATAVSAGNGHTCATTSAGALKCWGLDNMGELGDNATSYRNRPVPVDVVGLSTGVVAASSALYHTCAVAGLGGLLCWGEGANDLLGNGSSDWSLVPASVTGLSSGYVSVSAGPHHTCALKATGGITCWGANDFGQLGSAASGASSGPVDVVGF